MIKLSKVTVGVMAFGWPFLVFFCLSGLALALSVEDRVAVNESYALEAQGQSGKAIGKMAGVLKANPNDYFVNYRLAWLFSLQKLYKNSADHYSKAAALSPESVEPWLGLSYLYTTEGNFAEAARTAKELLQRSPKNYYGMLRLNLALLRLKEYEQGLEKVNEAIKAYPTDAVFLEQKAFILKELGRKDEAREAVSQLILISPKSEFARSFLSAH